jgi:hypothetical protein
MSNYYNYNSQNSHMSINDVNRILHDYRHGAGSYEHQASSQYSFFVNTTRSFSSYGHQQYGGNKPANVGYYMSSNYL